MSRKPPDPPPQPPASALAPAPAPAFGSVEDWAPFIGIEDATQLLAGLGALGGSHELLDQLTAAVIPAGPAAGAAAPSPEEQLRAAERKFRLLVEHLPCVAFIASMGAGPSQVYVNDYIESLLGYTREEWLRDPFLWYWRVHPEDRPAWNEEFARGLVHGGPWRADCRFLAADGHAVWVRGHARIVRDDAGRPLYLQGIAFDIGDLKQAAVAARGERDAAQALLDALPEALVAIAPGGAVAQCNAAARQQLGAALQPPLATLAELATRLAAPALPEAVARCGRELARDGADGALGGRRVRIECLPPQRSGDGVVVLRITGP